MAWSNWDDEKNARDVLLLDKENEQRIKEYVAVLRCIVYRSCVKLVERTPLLAAKLLLDCLLVSDDDDAMTHIADRLCEVDPGFNAWWSSAAVLCGLSGGKDLLAVDGP